MASFIPCGPCSNESIEKSADKWCTDCNKGFCNSCEKAHTSMMISRDHKLITTEDYGTIRNINVRFECEEHGSKLEMYCKVHEKAICTGCFSAMHKGCSDAIIPLAEAVKNAKSSTALADLELTINSTLENIKDCIKDREASSERIETQEMVIKKMIFDIRENINKHLDDMENKLIYELSTTTTSCKSKYSKLQNQLINMREKIQSLQKQTSEIKWYASNLHVFLSTHQMNKEIHDEVNVLKEAILSSKNYQIEIEIHKGITSLLKDVIYFARLKVNESTINCPLEDSKQFQGQAPVQIKRSVQYTKLKLIRKIPVKATTHRMHISGCTFLENGNILVADYDGQDKLIEYDEDGHFIRDILVSARPWGLTVINTDLIAVSYNWLNYIEIIDIKKMFVLNRVQFDNNCCGISHSDGQVYVVVGNEKIVVLTILGTILNTINCDSDAVYNITSSKTRIYYTLQCQSSVYCCNTTGEKIWDFKNESISPDGIVVDKYDNVFVAGIHSTNNVMTIQDDGKASKILLTEHDGLYQPSSLCYNIKEKEHLTGFQLRSQECFIIQCNLI